MPESAVCPMARARGATCLEVDGWTVAGTFGDPAREYRALREEAALVDFVFRERVWVTGADRVAFLQGMLSNDLKALGSGAGAHALLLSDQGKVVADFIVLIVEDGVLLDGMASAVPGAVEALERYLVADDVELQPLATTDHMLGIYGPDAAAALERLGVAAPPRASYAHQRATMGGCPVRVVRVPLPAPGGFLCILATADAAECWTACVESGIRPAGQTAFDVWRIEGGMPWDGRDVGRETLALEAPLEDAISFKKGCYLGQEVIERVTARGHVNRKLVGLEIDGETVPASGDHVAAADRDVGWITSAGWSWRLGRPVALGYVRREHLAPGTTLAVRGVAGETLATVRTLPLVRAVDEGGR